jgi:hypothetical protein
MKADTLDLIVGDRMTIPVPILGTLVISLVSKTGRWFFVDSMSKRVSSTIGRCSVAASYTA